MAQHTQIAKRVSDLQITSEDVLAAGVSSWEDYDSSLMQEYSSVSTCGPAVGGGYKAETPATLPAAGDMVVTIEGAQDAMEAAEPHERIQESWLRIPEVLELRCATMRLAELCNGDIVPIDLAPPACVPSRRDGWAGFADRQAMVMMVGRDWSRWTTTVRMLVYPDDGSTFA